MLYKNLESEHTYLDKLSTGESIRRLPSILVGLLSTYLGEKVVNEKEYLSAITAFE